MAPAGAFVPLQVDGVTQRPVGSDSDLMVLSDLDTGFPGGVELSDYASGPLLAQGATAFSPSGRSGRTTRRRQPVGAAAALVLPLLSKQKPTHEVRAACPGRCNPPPRAHRAGPLYHPGPPWCPGQLQTGGFRVTASPPPATTRLSDEFLQSRSPELETFLQSSRSLRLRRNNDKAAPPR